MNEEKRGIYNVTFNDKNSTPINAELEAIENQLKSIGESLTKDREKLENAQKLQDSKVDIESHKSHLRRQK